MATTGPRAIAFTIDGPIARADLPGLCDRVCALLEEGRPDVAYCEVSGVEPDAVTVDALARLQLAAHRHACLVRLRGASEELRALVAYSVEQVTDLYCTLDGQPLRDLSRYRTISPVFEFWMPPTDNLYQFFGYDFSGDAHPAVADGFYVLLNPLSAGEHVLTFGGKTKTFDGSGNPAVFSLDVTYHITVK